MDYIIFLPNRKAKYYWIDLGLAICGIILLLAGKWMPALLMFLMALMGFLIRKKPYLHFSEKGVRISMVWVKTYQWRELNRVLLKDDILTLDFVDNKLFQEVIQQDGDKIIDEEAFNNFCAKQVVFSQSGFSV